MDHFCLSAYKDPQEFLDEHADPYFHNLFIEYLHKMADGTLSCSHSFYLKMYHVELAAGRIPVPEVELLLVDECGDLTELTIDIFRLIKADKKIAVGDPMQNIYSFNHTVNAFNVLTEGTAVNLTESFRVSHIIAARIQAFTRKHLDPSFDFTGRTYASANVTSKAYISRGNAGLLEEMIYLMGNQIPFHTTRRIGTILELPLILANLSNGKPIEGYQYKHLEQLRKRYETMSKAAPQKDSIQSYIMSNTSGDDEIQRAFKVMMNHGPRTLNDLVKYATECRKHPCELTLTTAHSSKGLEFSSVEIAPDLNISVATALADLHSLTKTTRRKHDHDKEVSKLEEELRLYYVACSRAMVELINATQLPGEEELFIS